ncbi:Rhodanese-related sulfurtransferase [Jannaschia faecimaris]|uniref:Rhodanese-related sulfurtransferase n=1 Tax=Jannaschia faecimaris TaxID=1244108 RepID=A0A1H3QA52_9RHOB|nr:rhodanese-like domain-containing protein [Jannaschia faecimaris]SDZ10434.1 Rhodanese-related sulfurtransferase [Jannaschia faecimaris]
MAHLFTSPEILFPALTSPDAPAILDVRTEEDACADPTRLPTARRLTLAEIEEGAGPGGPCVVYCQKGGKISQLAAALLRARGKEACVLTGGHLAWIAANLSTVTLDLPTRWVMSLDPTLSEVAALWLLRRLIDPSSQALAVARGQIEAACSTWQAEALPQDAETLAASLELSHPVVAQLIFDNALGAERVLRGRLARTGNPEAALDLIDDLLAGARK